MSVQTALATLALPLILGALGDGNVTPGEGAFGASVSATEEEVRRITSPARPLTLGEIAQIPFNRVRDAGCEGGPLGTCEVPVPCGDGATEQITMIYVFTNTRTPESQCTPTAPVVTDAAILQAFREVPLPQATLTIQPPDGTTLVNLATNFYTHAEPFTTTVTVLDHTVTLDIHPTTYTWTFGDGTTTTTTTPGAPYPDLQVTHAYTQPGTVTTQVTTTWSADYQIDDGPWNTVDGTVTMTSPTVPLTIREATPVLVD